MDDATGSSRRQAGVAALAAVLLFGVGSAIWGLDMPDAGAPVAEVVDFYRDTEERIVVGATLSLLAIGALVWFAAALRRVLVDAGADEALATTAFAAAILGGAAGLSAEAINMAGALRVDDPDTTPELLHALFEISQVYGSYAAGVGLGVFALATAAAAWPTRVLPRPVLVLAAVVGVLLLTPLARINVVSGTALIVVGLVLALALLRPRVG